ncbi:TetR family transcriptional regulator [Azorhizobium oxalatiphilum]|uniref:TetR family transcriptional regulator n=1 Tax=Azorhizobium oxalatiphilum TaxID=980631 RepID=A0A917FI46_9HYPH|nr:TetR/AcrR family transcriptional regulator [Azorhizobium oxalatiphilum]GGF84817.1 TetR family transcriptional regulator [Azorhizobium oxalatiphilum]
MSLVETHTQQDHRNEQRQRILSAAATCFARDGFHGTSMQKVCAEASMSPGALYRYFPSKEAIIAAIVENERAERARVFDNVSRSANLIEGLIGCMMEFLADDSASCAELSPEILAEASRNPKLREIIEPFEEETRQMIRALILGAQQTGEIDPAIDPDDLQVLFSAIGDGLILHRQMHPHWQVRERLPTFGRLIARMVAPPVKATQP